VVFAENESNGRSEYSGGGVNQLLDEESRSMSAMLGRKNLTSSVASVFVGLALFSAASMAEFDRGQALYENHCRECHESLAHTRDGRHVASLDALRARVASWSVHSGLGWSDEDVDDVADYLNRQFYRLTK
jgi:mono/diheme cytochrome c family protein